MSNINKHKIKFYSQHGEDYLIWKYFDFKDKGFYIEVGAFDGKYLSNTYSFEQQGWSGICIEPHPVFYSMCLENRKGSHCVNKACVSSDKEEVVLQADPTGLFSGLANDNTFRKKYVGGILENKQVDFEDFQMHSVKASKLDDILQKYKNHFDKIDFISIDVEGTEIDVLDGFNLELHSPELIVIEANSDEHQEKLTKYLENRRYYFVRKLGVNLFFVNSSECIKKLRDIKVHCSIEQQTHPLGDAYSVEGISAGLHIDEEKDNLIAAQRINISNLTNTVAELDNTTAWQKKSLEEKKREIQDQSSKVGQLIGECEWLRKRHKEQDKKLKGQKKKIDTIFLESNRIKSEKQDLINEHSKLKKQYADLQGKLNHLVDESVISKYLSLKRFLKGLMKQPQVSEKTSLKQEEKKKKIIINVQYGLGNRLRALASAQLLAQKTGREFVLLWIPDIHCQARFSDLFVNNLNVVDSHDKVDIEHADMYNYMDSEEGSEKNKLINHDSPRDIYVKSAFVLNHKYAKTDDINHLVSQLEPLQEIKDIVNQFNVKDAIGLHIREGGGQRANKDPWDSSDNWSEDGKKNLYYWREKSAPEVFVKELDRLLKEDKSLKFFLAADSEDIYRQFQDRYKDKIVYLKRDLYDRSVDQQKYALADILLLSRTKYILGSYWSSFSEIAQRFGGNAIKYSGKDF